MANYGQMLAAAQAYATPEQQRKLAQSESQGAEFEVEKEKKSQMEELQDLMEKAMQEASRKKGMFGGLGKLGELISFIPGIGTGVGAGMQALSGFGQAKGQKDALKKLLKDPKFAKYKGTWLGDPTKQYLKDVEGLAGDIDPLKTGLTSLATSMTTGKIAKGIGEKFKGAFSPSEVGISEQITGQPGGVGIRADLLGGKGGGFDIGKTLDPRFTSGEFIGQAAPLNAFDVIGGDKMMTKLAGGGLKELFGGDGDWLMDLIGEAGKGTENLQALPLLMKMFGGGGGQEMDFDAQSYFQ